MGHERLPRPVRSSLGAFAVPSPPWRILSEESLVLARSSRLHNALAGREVTGLGLVSWRRYFVIIHVNRTRSGSKGKTRA